MTSRYLYEREQKERKDEEKGTLIILQQREEIESGPACSLPSLVRGSMIRESACSKHTSHILGAKANESAV